MFPSIIKKQKTQQKHQKKLFKTLEENLVSEKNKWLPRDHSRQFMDNLRRYDEYYDDQPNQNNDLFEGEFVESGLLSATNTVSVSNKSRMKKRPTQQHFCFSDAASRGAQYNKAKGGGGGIKNSASH